METQHLMVLDLDVNPVELPARRVRRTSAQDNGSAFFNLATDSEAEIIVLEVLVRFGQCELLIAAIIVTGIHARLLAGHIFAEGVFQTGSRATYTPLRRHPYREKSAHLSHRRAFKNSY